MELRDRIIDETTTMFVTYGIKSIRMDDIAEKLGISKRTIYEIFGDKEALIRECLLYYIRLAEQTKDDNTTEAANVIEELLMLLEDRERRMESNYKLMRDVQKFYPNIYDEICCLQTAKGYEAMKKKLEKGVGEGLLLSYIDYELAVSIFSASISGIITKQNISLPKGVTDVDAFRYVITYFFRGIATDKGIAMIDRFLEKLRQNEQAKR